MRGNIQHTILCTVLLALAGQIVSSKFYYTTWSSQAGNINSTFASWDVTTGQQGMLFSQYSVVVLSAYNSKSNLFHLVGNGVNSVNLTTIDGQGNLISSVPTVSNLQCLKYSASQNALIGATMSTSGKITIVTVDYTTGRVSDRFSVPAAFGGDWIRSCDIDDATSRLVLHQQTNMDAGSAEHLTMVNYQSNAVVGQYKVVFNNTNNNYKFLANVAFSNSQLACIVGTSGNSTWSVQLGKFNFNSASGDVTPALITPQPVVAFVVGFAYNPATSMFYTLSQGFPDDSARPWYLDTYDRSGARVRQMMLANQLILQPRDLIVVA